MCVSGSGSLMNVHGVSGPVTSVDDLHAADDRCKELFFFAALEGMKTQGLVNDAEYATKRQQILDEL